MPSQPYSAVSPIIHNQSACQRAGDLLRVTTPVEQWAYAVEFQPLECPSILETGMILNVRTRVYEGEIGLGLLTSTGGEYRCENRVAASEESELVEIPLPKGTALGSLMLRNTSVRGSSRADIEIVGCEIAPDPEQPYWAALRIVHSQAACRRLGDSLRVTTPEGRWAYAVEFPPQEGASMLETDMTLKMRARVYEGELGLGVMTPDRGYHYEIRVAASEESELVEISLPKGGALGSLMLRNTSASGRSKADIEVVGCEIAPSPEEIVIDPAIFAPFKPWSGWVPGGYFAEWTGTLTRVDVWAFSEDRLAIFNRDRHEDKTVPINGEIALDWAPLAQAVNEASDTFRMAALGAGFGRWLAAGAALAAQTGRDYRLLGIEAEPQHFEWMLRHFKENKIPESRYIALNAAAVGTPGDCWFAVGNSQAWYGQTVYSKDHALPENAKLRRSKGVTIDEILSLLTPLDYLHMDIQGAELDVLSYRPDRLNREVRLLNIGTHSAEIETGLRKLFRGLGWECLYDVKLGSKHPIRLGETVVPEFEFGDGVQVWRNPRL